MDEMDSILDFCLPLRKWKLSGKMGSGKTTFVKYLGQHIGISEVASPTFPIVNEYEVPMAFRDQLGTSIYHIDLYRLENEEELYGIGLEEYLLDDHLALVEWPGLSSGLWPEQHAELLFEERENNVRELLIILHE